MKISCKLATELIEREKVASLSFFEKLKLKFHLSFCNVCKNYEHQSQLIDDFFKKESKEEDFEKDVTIEENSKLKKEILNKLNH